MFTAADAKKLASNLRPLKFNLDQDEAFAKSPAVQKYLNHYKINFPQSINGVRHGFGRFEAGGYTIACHYWVPSLPRGTVFVIHGYFDHVGLFNHIIRFALQNDFAVVAFDLPGMGLSSGDRASIADFDEYTVVLKECLKLFKSAVPSPWHCVAQSAGSTPVLSMLLKDGEKSFERIVLLGPLVEPWGWKKYRWVYLFGRFFIRNLRRVFTPNSHDQEFLLFLRKSDPLQSRKIPIRWVGAMKAWIDRFAKFEPQKFDVLVIQGDQDTTVEWQSNLDIIKQKLPNTKVKMVPQARHHLVAESAPYRAQVFAAIKSYWDKK